MNSLFSFFLICFLSYGCKKSGISSIEKQSGVTKDIPTVKVTEFQSDSTINGLLILREENSINKFCPSTKNLNYIERIREQPVIIFASKSKNEYLLAYQYEGDNNMQFSCFEIGFWADEMFEKKAYNTVPYSHFSTESNIMLGLSLDSLKKIKGDDFRIETAKEDSIIIYEINSTQDVDFLRRNRMPSYFMKYRIKNNLIYNIIFGFDYP